MMMPGGSTVLESAPMAKAGASLGRWELCSAPSGERQPALHKPGAGGRRSLAPAGGWLVGDYRMMRPTERGVTIRNFF